MDGEMNMSSIASVSYGNGDTIPEDLEEDYFPPNFKEYMLKEQLKWLRCEKESVMGYSYFEWVFWSEQDHEIEPSLSLDNPNVCAIPKVEYNIRHALEKLMSSTFHLSLSLTSLLQFWAPTKTLEGRTRLTTQYQPFSLSNTWGAIRRQQLCEYRMKMCSSEYNNYFYADGQSREEQLGLLGRVFFHQLPESTPYVKCYSTKEYPQRDLALRCEIRGSWAVPVFEHSSRTCIGVLEMVSICPSVYHSPLVYDFHDIQKNLQEHGLQCFDGHQACEVEPTKKEKRIKGLTQAFKELKTALRSVCESHKLPLAMTWVPCSDCNGLRRCKVYSAGVEFCRPGDSFLAAFLEVSKWRHLRKGLVAGRVRSSPNMLYCPDITQLSLDEYPLVHYARQCNLSGWFTIYLLCKHTGNFIYVLEFFLSDRSKDKDDEKTTLSLILGTIEEKFTTFRFASGKELGELIRVEVIQFQENQKIHCIQATKDFSTSSISSSVQSSASVANTRPGFQDPSMGTINAEYDLNSDSSSDSNPSSDADQSFEQSTTSVPMVTIKAKYASSTTIFKLSLPCRLVELQQKVTEWLNLQAGTYHVQYEDELGKLILIACDEDLQDWINTSRFLGNTSIVVTSLNPTN